MKAATVVFVFFILVLMTVLAFLPATLADGRLAAASGGRLRISAASGSLWKGQGTLTDAHQQWQLPMAWTLDPMALLRGEIRVVLAPPRGALQPEGAIVGSGSGVSLTQLRAVLPASAFTSLLPLREVPALGGDVAISASDFRWNGSEGQGALQLRWQLARLATTVGSADLGTVEATVTPQGKRLAGRVSNTGGEVRIAGTVAFDGAGSEGELNITPLPGAAPALVRALANLGTPDASGAVRLAWRNSFR